jgi:hypothetical protein
VCTLVCTAATARLHAQAVAPGVPAADGGPAARVGAVPASLRLDGALDEPAWTTADSIADFTQRDPAEGQPTSERTVVRILAAADGLWVGVLAYDRNPAGIRHAQLRRDAEFETDDAVTLMLSPMEDRRTAFLFSVNPNGAVQDAEVLTFESESPEWDGVWDARARITAKGWQAEIVIPWQTLRYRRGADTWGFNVRRFIRRKNEEALWRGWRRPEGIRFLERQGTLAGFQQLGGVLPEGLPRRALAEVRPYVTSTARLTERAFPPDGLGGVRDSTVAAAGLDGDAGLDAKLAPTPTLTLDLTVNADFAQAEVDRQVVNLTRFPLFFPEQRPFFTEGAGIFEFGRREQTQLFYSRRIGLSQAGEPVPLLAGARLTGRLGGQQLGALVVRTGGDAPATSAVVRVKRDVLGRGYVGAMTTLQDTYGEGGAPLSSASGVDFNFPYIVGGQNFVVLGNAAWQADGAGGPTPSFARIVFDYPNDNADIVARFDRVGEGFDPPLGFVVQSGIMRYAGQTALTPRPRALGPLAAPLTRLGVRKLLFNALGWDYVERLGGGLDNATFEVSPLGAAFESGDEFGLNLQRFYDRPGEAFEVFPGVTVPVSEYRWDRVELVVATSPARTFAADLTASTGAFYGGTSRSAEAAVRTRVEPHVLAAVELATAAVSLPARGGPDAPLAASRFTANTARLRLDVATSPRLTTTLFGQWDNASERVALNARVRWTRSPGSDAYLVWNSAWPSDVPGGVPWRRPARGTLVAKYVQYLRL